MERLEGAPNDEMATRTVANNFRQHHPNSRSSTSCCFKQTFHLLPLISITILLTMYIHNCQTAGLPTIVTNPNNNNNNNNHHQFNSHLLRAQTSNPHRINHDQTSYSGPILSTNAPSNQMQPLTSLTGPLTSQQNLLSNPYLKATYEQLLDLRQQMLTRSIKFDEIFRNLLSSSKLSLHNMFADTYGLMYEANTEIFTGMFEGLEQYYATGQIKLTKSMENFFERLYQKIFQVYNSNMAFAPIYLECATEQLTHLKPFKDVPEKLIDGIRHAFVAARTFVQALNNGIDIIKSIISLGQPAQCTHMINEKLLKYSSGTIGNQQTNPPKQPCLGFCEQVISRCIGNGNLEALNERWKAYVMVLSELAMKLSTSYNIETIIAPLDVQISEAIMNFQENAQNISDHVFQICGSPVSNSELQFSSSKPMSGPHRIGKRAASPGPVVVGVSNQNRHNQHTLSALHQTNHPSHWLSSPKDLVPIGLPHKPKDLRPIGQKSPMIIDEIKNYMLTTRSFWHNLPNSVCTSNYTLGANASKKHSSGCFQEKFVISDINSDLRYRAEMHQQINRLDIMKSKIENALAGIEIDWSNNSERDRFKLTPSVIDSPNIRLPPTTSTTPSTTTTTELSADDEEDDELSPDDSDESGSGDSEPSESHNDDGFPYPDPPDIDATTEFGLPEDDEPTDEPSTSQEPFTEPNNSIDQPIQPDVLITPPNQAGAQKSSQHSTKLLISNEHCILATALLTIVLLLLNSIEGSQIMMHRNINC